jgi:serine/threonine-protein kinase
MIGQTLAHFRIVDEIGAGGMGVVYRAYDEQLQRDVALKVLPAASFRDPAARARLLREARTASKLNHPNICTIHEVGEADGQSYIAMEYVVGQPLSARLSSGALPVEQVLRYGLQLAEALAHAHQHGVVHRDLKSANVVVTPEGRVKVLDFGLAKQLGEEELAETVSQTLTMPGTLVGTLAYMSPEQLRGRPADPRSDVWALGVVLHEMASGQRPFQGKTGFELSSAILSQAPPPLPPECSAELRGVIERCLAKEPGERYQRAGEVRAALEAVHAGVAIPAWPAWKQALTRRRWLLLAPVSAAAAIALALNVTRLRKLLPGGAATQKFHSLAVLPLANSSGDAQQEYFVDGVTNALIGDLSKVTTLLVISRTSAMRYKNAAKPLPEIGRELGVETLVQGSVAREGSRVLVTAELIEAASQRRLWSKSYDGQLTGIRAMQGEMVRAIAREIKGELSPQEETRLANRREINPQVLEAYLKGTYYLQQSTPETTQKGMEYLHEAVEKDPMDPLAYAGLANGYVTLAHGEDPPPDALPRAKAAARTALELDGMFADAVFALGVIKGYDEWDWEGGDQAIQRAIELNPSLAMAHYHLAWFRALFGRMEEAITEHKRARECDPLNPLHTAWLGRLYQRQGRYAEALEEADKAIKMSPNSPLGYDVRGWVYAEQGMHPEAIAAIQKAAELAPAYRLALGPLYALAGRKDEARRLMAELKEQKTTPWNAFWRARTYAALGDKDEAFRWLNYEHPHIWTPWLLTPEQRLFMKPLHGDPRFRELQCRMHVLR